MSELRQKINENMDVLQSYMESNYHLKRPAVVLEHLDRLSIYFHVLCEEDREYIQCARHAIEEEMEWVL